MFQNMLNMMTQPPPFREMYRVFPVAFANKENLEAGNKVLLPSSALHHLVRLNVTYPMLFELKNSKNGTILHCGVQEFSAEEGKAFLPYWLMQNLGVEAGELINVNNVSLPKGTFVQLRPHRTKFTELSNPRVVLERALRNFSCLTQGETIRIKHGDLHFDLDIVQVKPGKAISVFETDLNVDFLPPLDYDQAAEEKKAAAARAAALAAKEEAAAVAAKAQAQATSSDTKSQGGSNGGGGYFSNLKGGHSLSGKRRNPTSPLRGPKSSPASSSTSSSSLSSGSNRDHIKEDDKFTYIYSKPTKPGEKPRLLRRIPRRRGFTAFGGKGNSLSG